MRVLAILGLGITVFLGLALYETEADFSLYPDTQSYRALSYDEREVVIKELLEKYSPEDVWGYLYEVSHDQDTMIINSHSMAHLVGNALYEDHGTAGVMHCSDAYNFGCYHGVMERFLDQRGPGSIHEAEEGCRIAFPDYATTDTERYGECLHGIGHGLLTWESYNIPAALSHCSKLEATLDRQLDCSYGIFMENADSGPYFLYEDTPGYWGACSGIEAEFEESCGYYHPMLLSRAGYTYEAVAAECSKAPAPTLREFCIRQTGSLSSRRYQEDVQAIFNNCTQHEAKDDEDLCVTAAALTQVAYQYRGWEATSNTLCSSLSGDWQRQCFAERAIGIGQYIK